jgi:hypothetical protein
VDKSGKNFNQGPFLQTQPGADWPPNTVQLASRRCWSRGSLVACPITRIFSVRRPAGRGADRQEQCSSGAEVEDRAVVVNRLGRRVTASGGGRAGRRRGDLGRATVPRIRSMTSASDGAIKRNQPPHPGYQRRQSSQRRRLAASVAFGSFHLSRLLGGRRRPLRTHPPQPGAPSQTPRRLRVAPHCVGRL